MHILLSFGFMYDNSKQHVVGYFSFAQFDNLSTLKGEFS